MPENPGSTTRRLCARAKEENPMGEHPKAVDISCDSPPNFFVPPPFCAHLSPRSDDGRRYPTERRPLRRRRSVAHGLVCLLTLFRFMRSFVQLDENLFWGSCVSPFDLSQCAKVHTPELYNQKESRRLSFFCVYYDKVAPAGAE